MWRSADASTLLLYALLLANQPTLITEPVKANVRSIPSMFSVARMRTDLSSVSDVGSRRAGLACLPAGGLKWRDLALDPDEGASAIHTGLLNAGLDVGEASELLPELGPAKSKYLIVVTVRAVKATACTPYTSIFKLLDSGRKFKGTIRLRLSWNVYDTSSQKSIGNFEVEQETKFQSSDASFTSLLKAGLVAAANKNVEAIKQIALEL